jgi:hypothetical protein
MADLNKNGIDDALEIKPGAPKPQGLASTFGEGATGSNSASAKFGVSLGFNVLQDGSPAVLVPSKIGAYVSNLASTNKKAYLAIKSALAAAGIKRNDPVGVGSAIARLAENMQASSDPIIKAQSLEEFLTKASQVAGAPGTATGPTKNVYLTTPEQAAAELDAQFTKLFGRAASKEEKIKYYNDLKKAQEANPQITKKGKSGENIQTGGLGADAKTAILNNAITRAAKSVPVSTVSGAAGGKTVAATGDYNVYISALKQTAAAYGVSLTNDQLGSYALNAMTSGAGIDVEKEKIKNIAKGLYSGISPFIDQGLTTKDLLQPYMNIKAQTLEIPVDAIGLNNPEGQQVVSQVISGDKLLPLYDYEKSLRQDPRWRFTKNANEQASGFVLQVLKDFGIAG